MKWVRSADRLRPDRFPRVAVILGIAAFAVLVGLGTWQVERLAWKEALLSSIDQRIHAAPRPLAEVEREFVGIGRRRLLAGRGERDLRPRQGAAFLRDL